MHTADTILRSYQEKDSQLQNVQIIYIY